MVSFSALLRTNDSSIMRMGDIFWSLFKSSSEVTKSFRCLIACTVARWISAHALTGLIAYNRFQRDVSCLTHKVFSKLVAANSHSMVPNKIRSLHFWTLPLVFILCYYVALAHASPSLNLFHKYSPSMCNRHQTVQLSLQLNCC